jgi:2,4-dienoyl-CoA reductase-like NADH-dependent reductase (Old Yellow Enzyme family)/thioredoxin reductase
MSQERVINRLFSPIKVGGVELKNRIIMAPMVTSFAGSDGFMTEREKSYFIRRAMGGVALITIGDVTIAPNSQVSPNYEGIWDNKFILTWKQFAKAVHDAGAKLSVQLSHAGSECRSAIIGNQPIAPSALVSPLTGEITREVTKEEIEELIQMFAEGAVRARDAGVDVVEIQGSQGFLVHNFMTPLFNRRSDEYGGDLNGRIKFAVEIIKRIKKKAGDDYPVIFRMVASDLADGGLTLEDTKAIAPIIAEAGADALHFTGGAGLHLPHLCMPPVDAGTECIVELVAKIKSVVKVPVIVAQRIVDAFQAERMIRAGKTEIVSLGRALICDPDWPRKAAEGAVEDIRKCIGCCQGCLDRVRGTVTCLQNPEVGREKDFQITRAEVPRRVLVIGGGPAGLEAAKVAALRGHEVTLYEKNRELGGQWILASIPPKKQEFKEVIRYNIRQLEELGVNIQLNKKVTSAVIEEINPDVVVVATGATPFIPEIPGVAGKNIVTAHDILSGRIDTVGNKVAVLGGGLVGCETADFLAAQEKKVTIVEMLDEVATDVGSIRKTFLMQRLDKAGVEILTSTRVKEIADHGIIATSKDGQAKNIGNYDFIVLALGARSVNEIAKQIEGVVSKIYVIGDALEPRKAIDAIAEGASVGREI